MSDTRVAVACIGHINLRASETMIERLRAFYREVVGLREGPRPHFRSGSRGYWLYAGDRDVMHLTIDPHDADVAPPRDTAFNHIAFACRGLSDTLLRLREAGIDFVVDQVDALQQVQLFLTDPAGTAVELTFTAEPLPV
ncbi:MULTISPECIES: VOC family protein [Oleiagrimonas]|uniref:Diguanylate cyclase n=1 Tax=Oleiagrimonas citrea TaxID=1665687 RepID=A0A846ZKL6_9GAMM|nr:MULTISPECIES: VOC family protein [Oleiagrimonas]NKZ37941.1 diguanylate cyclase [Oleiagrimonas citrea]